MVARISYFSFHPDVVRKRNALALSVLLTAVLAVTLWHGLRPQEPIYQGKRLSEWLTPLPEELRGISDGEMEWRQTEEAVRQAGTNAIPTLLRLLRVKDSAAKVQFMRLAQRQHWREIRYFPAEEWNSAAARAFKVLGAEARYAVPALVEIADRNISPASHYAAIAALGNIGPAARGAVPALLRYTTGGDSSLRWHAINSLAAIGAEPDRVVPVLIDALEDPNSRPSAASALGEYGTNARPAVPRLIRLLHSQEDITDKRIYTNALKKIHREAAVKAGIK